MPSKSAWVKVCDKRLLDFLLIKGSSKQRKFILQTALWGFLGAIIALAGPSWKKIEVPNLTPENPLMLILNVSTAMENRALSPDLLTRAKFKMDDLLKILQGQQVGLIVYTNEPFLISPITDDGKIISNLLPEIATNIMPLNGERLDRAIDLAVKKMQDAGYKNGNIVVFSADAGQNFSGVLKAVEKAKKAGFATSCLAISAKNVEQLELISKAGDGIYSQFSANDSDVQKIATMVGKGLNQELKKAENKRSTWLDYGYYMIIIPLLCCLYFFRKGVICGIILLAMAGNAQAGFFFNDNQEGLKAFKAENYTKAAEKFKDAKWKASSLYKAGNYESAYQQFSLENTETAKYNQANALAKGGKTDEAIAKYEEILKDNSEHEDAKFNLEYLKQQKQQNQQQNQNNQDKNNQKNQEQKQSEQSQGQDKQQQKEQDAQQKPQASNNENDKKENTTKQGSPKEEKERKEETEQAGKAKKSDEKQKYDEETQALEQQYREIPEEPGGLLRAYIYKEYLKNRYGDDNQ